MAEIKKRIAEIEAAKGKIMVEYASPRTTEKRIAELDVNLRWLNSELETLDAEAWAAKKAAMKDGLSDYCLNG
jgi:hypothetical protein